MEKKSQPKSVWSLPRTKEDIAVYLAETGRTEATRRVDIITPKDQNGDEMVIIVDSKSVTISRLSGTSVQEKAKIILSEI